MQILQTCLDDIFPGPRWCVHKGNTGTHTLWFFWGRSEPEGRIIYVMLARIQPASTDTNCIKSFPRK